MWSKWAHKGDNFRIFHSVKNPWLTFFQITHIGKRELLKSDFLTTRKFHQVSYNSSWMIFKQYVSMKKKTQYTKNDSNCFILLRVMVDQETDWDTHGCTHLYTHTHGQRQSQTDRDTVTHMDTFTSKGKAKKPICLLTSKTLNMEPPHSHIVH